jgi:hypothetical protein
LQLPHPINKGSLPLIFLPMKGSRERWAAAVQRVAAVVEDIDTFEDRSGDHAKP